MRTRSTPSLSGAGGAPVPRMLSRRSLASPAPSSGQCGEEFVLPQLQRKRLMRRPLSTCTSHARLAAKPSALWEDRHAASSIAQQCAGARTKPSQTTSSGQTSPSRATSRTGRPFSSTSQRTPITEGQQERTPSGFAWPTLRLSWRSATQRTACTTTTEQYRVRDSSMERFDATDSFKKIFGEHPNISSTSMSIVEYQLEDD